MDYVDWFLSISGRKSRASPRMLAIASFVAAQQSGRDWGNADAASVDGINLRDGVTAKLDGRAVRKDCAMQG